MANNLEMMTEAELVAAWLDNLRTYELIEHVGAANRHLDKCRTIADEMKSRCGGQPLFFLPLLRHPDPEVRYTAAQQFRHNDPGLFRSTLVALQAEGGEIGRSATSSLDMPPPRPSVERLVLSADHPSFWQENNPPPPAMTVEEITTRLRAICPAESEALLQLARPAIGLWPQRPRADLPVDGSRLGGMPHAPHGFAWPMAETEPMLFLGQINCADLKGLPGSGYFPSHGLLALFGDHDTINGCMFTALGGAVRYWPQIDHLVPAIPPLELSDVFLVSELAFRPVVDMPHPDSEVVRAIIRDGTRIEKYRTFHEAMRLFGFPHTNYSYGFGKLLGWPHLVQNDELDFFLDHADSPFRLLIQIDSYGDGKNHQGWGPGGSLYFMIPEDDFAAGRLEEAQLTGQFT